MKRYAVVKPFMRQCVAFCHNHLAPPFLSRKTPQRAAKTSHLASRAHCRPCIARCDGSTVASLHTRSHTPRTSSASYTVPLFLQPLTRIKHLFLFRFKGASIPTCVDTVPPKWSSPLHFCANQPISCFNRPSDQKESAGLRHRGSVWYAHNTALPICFVN